MKKRGIYGFTLLELLIVIAVIAILAAIAYVALNPAQRFQDSRDSRRWADIAAVMNAVKVYQVDAGGSNLTAIQSMAAGEVYMIGTDSSSCNATCDLSVTDGDNCVDLAGLVTDNYLGEVPVSPDGSGTWGAGLSGYALSKATSGAITIQACESENTDNIKIVR